MRLGLDQIIVAGDVLRGMLAFRPGAFVHELRVDKSLLSRQTANALVNFAIAHALGMGLKTAIFAVDSENIPMQHYVERLGAVRQDSKIVYTLIP